MDIRAPRETIDAMKVTVGKEITVKCQVCAHDDFESHDILMNTPGMTFLGLDFANKTARCFVCVRCGFVHWFSLRKPN